MELNRNAGRQPLEQTHGLLAIPRGTGAGDTIIVGEYVFNLLGDLDTVNVKRLNVVDGSVTTASLEQPAHAMR